MVWHFGQNNILIPGDHEVEGHETQAKLAVFACLSCLSVRSSGGLAMCLPRVHRGPKACHKHANLPPLVASSSAQLPRAQESKSVLGLQIGVRTMASN